MTGVPEERASAIVRGEVAAAAQGLLRDCMAALRKQQGIVGGDALEPLLQLRRCFLHVIQLQLADLDAC